MCDVTRNLNFIRFAYKISFCGRTWYFFNLKNLKRAE